MKCWSRDHPDPAAMHGVSTAIALETFPFNDDDGGGDVCILRSDGTVGCADSDLPAATAKVIRMPGITDAEAMSFVGITSVTEGDWCVLRSDATIWCAGSNWSGRLARNPGWEPVRVPGF